MLFRELNRGKCKTYLIACDQSNRAILVDPIFNPKLLISLRDSTPTQSATFDFVLDLG